MTGKKKGRLYLIDGNNYIYRAFHAIRALSNSRGFPTNAVYGFTTMLLKVLREEKPEYVAVAFDSKGPTARHEIYPEYKATRPPMPDDLVPQIPVIRDLVRAFRIAVLEREGDEADDLIATAAKKAADEGLEVTVVSGDKDLLQLVGPRISVLDTMKEKRYDAEAVRERYGVEPEQLGDVLALAGDPVDNIPGVRGIGEKTAPGLIAAFGSLEKLYERLEEVPGARRKRLEEGREKALLSRRLVSLRDDVPLGAGLEDFRAGEPDMGAALAIFKEMEFSRLLRELSSSAPRKVERRYRLILERKDLEGLAGELRGSKGFAFDLETTSVDPMRAEIVGLSFSFSPGEACYVPVGHDYLGAPKQIAPDVALRVLSPLLEDPDLPKCGQNVKYDTLVLSRAGVEVKGVGFDTMVASYVINPTRHQHNLAEIALEYLDERVSTYEEVAGKGAKQIPFSKVDVEKARDYAAEDADVTFRLAAALRPRIDELSLRDLYYGLELPLVEVLAEMERTGVLVDGDALRDLSKETERQLQELMRKIWRIAGVEFNINSPKQLSEILYDRLGLPVLRKTKTGRSTDEGVLSVLAAQHELPAEVLSYRQLAKIRNTYLDVLPTLINPDTGRVHTSFNQTVTATGRLSSSDPNLQNIPVRTELGRRIRKAFVAPKGSILLSADYSQIELRIMAHLSGDEALREAFRRGEDIHEQTARAIFGGKKASAEHRRAAKAINFGIIYGMGAYGLSQQLGIDQKEAKEFIDRYFERFPGVRGFLDRTVADARVDGFVSTLMGRKRYLPEINAKNRNVVQFAERMAVNTPVQGSAADLIKKAMIEIHGELHRPGGKWKSRMVLQIHDELLFETPSKEAGRLEKMVREKMEGVMDLAVPVVVDVGRGPDWDAAH